jgi:putative tricarboxylic transport membrane protein
MRQGQRVAAAAFLIFSATVVLLAARMTYFDEVGPGPGFLPFWAGGLLVVLSAIWLLQVWWRPVAPDEPAFFPERGAATRVIIVLAALVLFTALLGRLGFRPAAFGFLVLALLALGRRDLFVVLAVALVGSFGVYHVFWHWLGVPLPTSNVQALQNLGL